jgi:branched-chain amino acid transport system ATP-binding protein
VLSVQDVHTYYGDSYVLQGVSLEVKPGEVVAILGRNGVGKTTLVRSIVGLTPPRRGRIAFRDADITRLPAHRIARMGIGLVPQGRRVFRSLTVRENLTVVARGEGPWSLEKVLELFPNLPRRLRSPGGKLSGGEQQMLAGARALVTNPKLLLMDEPSEGLAPTIVDDLIDAVHALVADGNAVLIVEQNLRAATSMADRQLIMVSGRIEHETTAAGLADDPALQKQYLGVDA